MHQDYEMDNNTYRNLPPQQLCQDMFLPLAHHMKYV